MRDCSSIVSTLIDRPKSGGEQMDPRRLGGVGDQHDRKQQPEVFGTVGERPDQSGTTKLDDGGGRLHPVRTETTQVAGGQRNGDWHERSRVGEPQPDERHQAEHGAQVRPAAHQEGGAYLGSLQPDDGEGCRHTQGQLE